MCSSDLPIILVGIILWINLDKIDKILHGGPGGEIFFALAGVALVAFTIAYAYSKLKERGK